MLGGLVYMDMLKRIKKKETKGFKDFVQSLETTSQLKRKEIIVRGLIEDPLYMSWVMKNFIDYTYLFKLSTDELMTLMTRLTNGIQMFVKAFMDTVQEDVLIGELLTPGMTKNYKDERKCNKKIPNGVQVSTQFLIVKAIRDLQSEGALGPFLWKLPSVEILCVRKYPPKDGVLELFYESEKLAAKGKMEKGLRHGQWLHFYENGKILAQGNYYRGQYHDYWEIKYPSGEPMSQGEYYQGEKIGEWKSWDLEGVEAIKKWSYPET